MPVIKIEFVLLVFGIIFLVVFLTRRAVKKVNKDISQGKTSYKPTGAQKTKLSDEQFKRSWKALSYLLILAALGNLYMVYTGVRSALVAGNAAWIFWVDVFASLVAALAAVMIWRSRKKFWVFIYFVITIIPIFVFMSIKGTNFKLSALIHLFPLVLLYFVLQPVWENMET